MAYGFLVANSNDVMQVRSMSNHYGFFSSYGNNVQFSVQGVYLASSTSAGTIRHIKGMGTYIHQSNIRHCIALYSARVLSKHTWINDQDRYLGRDDK